jgi:hypothetical protein
LTTLHPIAIRVLKIPGWQLRIWLAVALTLALIGLPLPVAGVALWLAALPYMGLTETLARMLGEQHRERRRLESEHAGHAVLLEERDARIVTLEADLARARAASSPRSETDEARIYRQVGLHPRAPGFLVTAARRAFRSALHPDRHPQHRQRAHERYLEAEATFDRIVELRA